MRIRALSLDLFDTLVDLEISDQPLEEISRALHGAVAEHLEIDPERFRREARASDEQLADERRRGVEIPTELRFRRLLERLGLDVAGLSERLTEIHMGGLRRCVRLPSHHYSLLRRLRERVPVALCSNFTHGPTARGILSELHLDAHLDPIVISVEIGWRKPRTELFDAVLHGLGCSPAETLHVGDSLAADVTGAAARGLRTAWLTRRVPDPAAALERHAGPPPDLVLADLEELIPRLGS